MKSRLNIFRIVCVFMPCFWVFSKDPQASWLWDVKTKPPPKAKTPSVTIYLDDSDSLENNLPVTLLNAEQSVLGEAIDKESPNHYVTVLDCDSTFPAIFSKFL